MAESKSTVGNIKRRIGIDALKMLFGFGLLTILGVLALGIAIGKVNAETSFGLEPIITTLATLAGAFAGWAFREQHSEDERERRKEQSELVDTEKQDTAA